MSLFESVLYGLVSGFTEFLPVSSLGHQAIMMRLFGLDCREPVRDILVHLAIIISLLVGCRNMLIRLRREQLIASRSRRKRTYERKGMYDLRLVKTAAYPLVIGLILYIATRNMEFQPIYLALFFLINGIVIMVPEYVRQGNKDSRAMSGFDGILMGLGGALSAFPGISRIGTSMGIAILRGADRHHALNWVLLLSIPSLVLFLVFDIVNLFIISIGAISFAVIVGYLLSAAAAFCGGYLSIVFIKFVTERSSYSGFAYYSWGAAMFSFVLYLIA